ncbi:hypothetical protein [Shinella sumterensis]|uniref:hypothetical protein n=1 Tax=Shinella sumterensis TaxID=1967501 RepID=UPI00106F056B|nr:hypothetical protein [Shinella sumterensis]MCD1265431.1 hypothetical protein [Shinella sumterensis]
MQDGPSFNDALNRATGAVLVKDKAIVLIVDGSERIFEFDSSLSEDVALQKVGVAGLPVHSDRELYFVLGGTVFVGLAISIVLSNYAF